MSLYNPGPHLGIEYNLYHSSDDVEVHALVAVATKVPGLVLVQVDPARGHAAHTTQDYLIRPNSELSRELNLGAPIPFIVAACSRCEFRRRLGEAWSLAMNDVAGPTEASRTQAYMGFSSAS